jgi:hypothetical protein
VTDLFGVRGRQLLRQRCELLPPHTAYATRELLEQVESLDALPLGRDIIHSVTNPIGRLTGAIHVYGGDFFAVQRSEWDAERLVEQAYDVEKTLRLFEESNRLYVSRR